jgi:hypothetical protein
MFVLSLHLGLVFHMPILDENSDEDDVIQYLESIVKNVSSQIVIPSAPTEAVKREIIKNIKQTITLFNEMKKNPQLAGVATHPAVSPAGGQRAQPRRQSGGRAGHG